MFPEELIPRGQSGSGQSPSLSHIGPVGAQDVHNSVSYPSKRHSHHTWGRYCGHPISPFQNDREPLTGQAHCLGSQNWQRPRGCPDRACWLRIPPNRKKQLARAQKVVGLRR